MRQHPRLYKFQSQTRSQSPGDLLGQLGVVPRTIGFNRRREANPLATHPPKEGQPAKYEFQSQTRSQSPGDLLADLTSAGLIRVSIADAKPIPWRRGIEQIQPGDRLRFNRRREANPLATRQKSAALHQCVCFNRRREANPLATYSQTSQAPGLSE